MRFFSGAFQNIFWSVRNFFWTYEKSFPRIDTCACCLFGKKGRSGRKKVTFA